MAEGAREADARQRVGRVDMPDDPNDGAELQQRDCGRRSLRLIVPA